MLKGVEPGPDAILNIEDLYLFALDQATTFGNTRAVNMVRNAVRLKLPNLHDVFTSYIISVSNLVVDINTGYLRIDKVKNCNCIKLGFQEYLEKNSFKNYQITENKKPNTENSYWHKGTSEKGNIKKRIKSNKIIKPKLILISRRGKRVDERIECSNCGKLENSVWLYLQSNQGKVSICNECKPSVLDTSFGRKDAMDYAILGGAFESDRRRH